MREQLAHLTSELIAGHLREIVAEPVKLALVVAHGKHHYRTHFFRAFRGLPVDDGIADGTYAWLLAQWASRYPDADPRKFLDATHVPSPEPELDIRTVTDWELESASSEEAKRYYNGGVSSLELLDRYIREDAGQAKGH